MRFNFRWVTLILFLAILLFPAVPTFATNTAITSVTTSDNNTDFKTHATLNGTVIDMGGSPTIDVWFEWGYTITYGNTITNHLIAEPCSVSDIISGFDPHRTVHFRFNAKNDNTIVHGNDQQIAIPASVKGTVYDAKGLIIPKGNLAIDGAIQSVTDTNGFYQINALAIGIHTIATTNPNYRSQTQTINITDKNTPYQLDFKGDAGLIPNTPDISYVLACVNKWQYPPMGLGISLSKLLSVINAWKYPK